jgi:hypothetical protein
MTKKSKFISKKVNENSEVTCDCGCCNCGCTEQKIQEQK